MSNVEAIVDAYTTTGLKQAYEAFLKVPDTHNWDKMQRAMLVHQQWRSSPGVLGRREQVMDKIESAPIRDWDEIIVTLVTGRTIEEVLKC